MIKAKIIKKFRYLIQKFYTVIRTLILFNFACYCLNEINSEEISKSLLSKGNNHMMQATVINKYGDHSIFENINMPIPPYGDHQVLIKLSAAGINPIDYKIRQGNLRYFIPVKFPAILGFDICGSIVAIGKKVTQFKLNDSVIAYSNYSTGNGYAEYIVLNETQILLKPENLTNIEAGAVPLAALTALQALRDYGQVKSGSKVLIIGAAGGVGTFATQLSINMGAKVTTVCSNSGINVIKNFNPDHMIDYQKQEVFELKEKFDVILDLVGGFDFNKIKQILTRKGIYVTTLPSKQIYIAFITNYFNSQKSYFVKVKNDIKDLKFILEQIQNKKLKVIIDKSYPVNKVSEAHQYLENNHVHGKVVLDFENLI